MMSPTANGGAPVAHQPHPHQMMYGWGVPPPGPYGYYPPHPQMMPGGPHHQGYYPPHPQYMPQHGYPGAPGMPPGAAATAPESGGQQQWIKQEEQPAARGDGDAEEKKLQI